MPERCGGYPLLKQTQSLLKYRKGKKGLLCFESSPDSSTPRLFVSNMILFWLCLVLYGYGILIKARSIMFIAQSLLLSETIGGLITMSFSQSLANVKDRHQLWRDQNLAAEPINTFVRRTWVLWSSPAPAHQSLHYVRFLFVFCMFFYLQTKHTRIPETNDTVKIASVLREPSLARLFTVRLITHSLHVRDTFLRNRHDQQRLLNNSWYIATLFFDYATTRALNDFFWLCSFPLPIVLHHILMADFTMLLWSMLSMSLHYPDSLGLSIPLRFWRYRLASATLVFLHFIILVFSLGITQWNDTMARISVLIMPLTLSITLAGFLLSEPRPTYLATEDLLSTDAVHTTFCSTCNSTVLRRDYRDLPPEKRVHHRNHSSLLNSVSSGCRICRAVWKHRTRLPKDFAALFQYSTPTTSFIIDDRVHRKSPISCYVEIISEECHDHMLNRTVFRVFRKSGESTKSHSLTY